VVEVRRVQSVRRASIGNQSALGKDFASKKVKVKIIILHKKRRELNGFPLSDVNITPN
jgi:hypothetical protein